MCGRTCLSLNKEQVRCACSYKAKEGNGYVQPDWLHEHNDDKEYVPANNIAPTDVTPVLISASRYKDVATTDRILKPMMWGVIPPWHKGDYKTHGLSTNNCRIENITSSKLYTPILKNGGRCVIVAEGFYEWQTTNKSAKVKQPYYIYSPQENNVQMDDPSTWNNTYTSDQGWSGVKLLYMAGLYNTWQNNGTVIYSYSVITMESNETFNWLHHRMPAILDSQEKIESWLDIDKVNPEMALSYLKPIKILSWHQVSTLVNNSKNKSAECNKKMQPKKGQTTQKSLTAWFKKTEKRKSNEDEATTNKKNKI